MAMTTEEDPPGKQTLWADWEGVQATKHKPVHTACLKQKYVIILIQQLPPTRDAERGQKKKQLSTQQALLQPRR